MITASAPDNRLRVLVVCARLPSTIQGGLDIRCRGLLAALAGFTIVGAFGLNGTGPPSDPRIKLWRAGSDANPATPRTAAQIGRSIGAGQSPFSSTFSHATAAQLVEAVSEFSPDVVILARMEVSEYLPALRAAGVRRVILDLDETPSRVLSTIADIETNRGAAMLLRRLARDVQVAETSCAEQVDEVWMSSEIEVQRLHNSGLQCVPCRVVPHALDVESFQPPFADRDRSSLIYPASFAYQPNADAVRFLVQSLLPLVPTASLTLIGSGAPQWMSAIDDPRIIIHGPVADIRPFLARAGALPLPLRAGGGTRLKVLEAFAAGVPVISTEFGVEGLQVEDGVHYLQADSPAEFASACRLVAVDVQRSDEISAAAHELVSRNHSHAALIDVLAEALPQRPL